MADLRRTIEILFQGEDGLTPVSTRVSASLNSFGSAASAATKPLASATDFVLKLDAAILGLGAVALGFAFNEAVKFEKSQLSLASVMKVSDGSVQALTSRVTKLSEDFGVGASEVFEAAAVFKAANFTIADSFALTSEALKLSKLTNLDAAAAADLLRRTLQGFGAPVSAAGRLLDILVAASNNTSASLDSLAAGMTTLGPVASRLGLSFEQTISFLAPLAERLGSGSEAADVLSKGFLKLLDPTKDARDALTAVGISQTTLSGKLLEGLPLLERVQAGFGKLTGTQQLFVAGALVGERQAKAFSDVLGGLAEQQTALGIATRSAGASQAELAEKLRLSNEVIAKFNVVLQNTTRTIGQQFQVEATGAVDAVTKLLQAFRDVVEAGGLEPLFRVLRPLITAFATDINKIALALPSAFAGVDFSRLARSLGLVGDSVRGLFGGVDLTTAEGLSKALQRITDIGATLVDVTRGIINTVGPAIVKFAELAAKTGDLDSNTSAWVGELFGAGKVLNVLLGAMGPLSDALGILSGILTALTLRALVPAGIAVTSFGTLLVGLGAVLLRVAGVGAVAAAAFELTSRALATLPGQKFLTGLVDGVASLTGLADEQTAALGKMSFSAADFGKKTVIAAKSTDDLSGAISGVIERLDKTPPAAARAASAILNSAGTAIVLFDEQGRAVDAVTGALINQAGVLDTSSEAAKKLSADITAAAVASAKAMEEARKKTEEFQLKLIEVASNERIKVFEVRANVQIEKFRADAAKVIAISDSISKAFESSGTVISAALGQIGTANFGRLKVIAAQLRIENGLRERQTLLQEKLANAQVEQLQAQTEALRSGDGLIRISADGLEPEIEAFMFKILDKIQLRAVEDSAAFLLGL